MDGRRDEKMLPCIPFECRGTLRQNLRFTLNPPLHPKAGAFLLPGKEDSPLPQKKRICLPNAASVRVIRLFALGGLAKLCGGFVIVALEGAAEASVVGIAYLQGDFGDGKIGAGEQGHALLQTDFFQIGGKAELGFIAQKRLQGALVYPEDIGD